MSEEMMTATEEVVAPEEAVEAVEPIKGRIETKEIRPGMTIRIHERIQDVNARGEARERIQMFEGMVLGLSGKGLSRTMTVRKISKGFEIERIYPLHTPIIDHVDLVKTAKVRRAKLNYLKDKKQPFKRKLKEVWTKV